ncbi:hypothetical protein [Blastococcus sp. Marseille-P5729]|uniref:hypothetical protein n=1 Tax=Blastococcus sp. Marseille-P5729 TaxID=2086582 RepID=UPI000D107BEB|nr:hypothetical protein [Blastococcus sp. Marseille-P5729]
MSAPDAQPQQVVLAIGVDIGEVWQDERQHWLVHRAGETVTLDEREYRLWQHCRRLPEPADPGAVPSRGLDDVLAEASNAGMSDPGSVLQQLADERLVASIVIPGDDTIGLAARLRALPRAVGAGVLPDLRGMALIGMPAAPLALVPPSVYSVYVLSAAHGSLLSACDEVVARQVAAGGLHEGADPGDLVDAFFSYAPDLISAGALALDLTTHRGS